VSRGNALGEEDGRHRYIISKRHLEEHDHDDEITSAFLGLIVSGIILRSFSFFLSFFFLSKLSNLFFVLICVSGVSAMDKGAQREQGKS